MMPMVMRPRLAARTSILRSDSGIVKSTSPPCYSCILSNNPCYLDCHPPASGSVPNPRLSMSYSRGFSATMSSWSLTRQPLSAGPSIGMQMPLLFASSGTVTLTSPYTALSMRGFNSTAILEFPIRRTRRRSERQSATTSQDQDDDDDDDDDDLAAVRQKQHGKGPNHAVMDPKEFRMASQALLDKLYKALLPMQEVNDPFFLSRGYDSDIGGEFIMIDLGPMEGQYTIQVDSEQCMLIFQSPISGQYDYFLSTNPENGEWVSAQDGHNFEGLLVRDLIRQCKGLPNL